LILSCDDYPEQPPVAAVPDIIFSAAGYLRRELEGSQKGTYRVENDRYSNLS
jgi:hypothetical protein